MKILLILLISLTNLRAAEKVDVNALQAQYQEKLIYQDYPLTIKDVSQNVKVSSVFSRATRGSNGAIFMRIQNTSDQNLVLQKTGVHAERIDGQSCSEVIELHTHIKEGDVYRMREVNQIVIPAKTTVMLSPGGLHIMLMQLKKPLKEGDSINLKLKFTELKR